MYNILVVEDELKIAQTVMDYLRREGYAVLHAATIAEALKLVSSDIDLIVLDLMLPDGQGEDLCAHVVGLYNTPVIMLTSKRSEQSRINGFASGADDYLAKPFDLDELLARIEVVLRRAGKSEMRLRYGDIRVDIERHTVTKAGVPIVLTPKEFDVLVFFMRNIDVAITREQLLSNIWEYNYTGESRTVDIHVQQVRRKLGLQGKLITIPKLGYRLERRG